jgi:hypothetical protein
VKIGKYSIAWVSRYSWFPLIIRAGGSTSLRPWKRLMIGKLDITWDV